MKILKYITCILLSVCFCFFATGYAEITGRMAIWGTAKQEIPEGLFIKSVTRKGNTSGLRTETSSFISHSTTVDVGLRKSSSGTAGSVTYTITVLNNTDYDYAYRGLYYQTDLQGFSNNTVSTKKANNKIAVEVKFPHGKVVPAHDTLQFEVTYTIGSSRTQFNSSTVYNTRLNYQFGINVETAEQAIEAVQGKFQDILNTSSTYETLYTNLDNKFDGYQEWTSNYIGNVGDATADDAMIVNTLFAGQLQILINGIETPATVIIKHENLDWNNMTGDDYTAVNSSNGGVFRGYGCEMTMYFTIDSLSRSNGSAPVYVSVYTCNRDAAGNIAGDWYQLGDTYLGNAPIVSYNGTAGGTGSFVTDNWLSVGKAYSPTEHYSYNVDPNTSIKDLVQIVDQEAIDEFQRLLDESKLLLDDMTYAGTGIELLDRAYQYAAPHYTLDANGNPIANAGTTRAQLCPIIADLDYALTEAYKVIEDLKNQGRV